MQLALQQYLQTQEKSEELRRALAIMPSPSAARYAVARELALSEWSEQQQQEALGEALGATLDERTRYWLGQSLANDENTSDEDLRTYYAERSLTAEQIDVALALRTWFMNEVDAHL